MFSSQIILVTIRHYPYCMIILCKWQLAFYVYRFCRSILSISIQTCTCTRYDINFPSFDEYKKFLYMNISVMRVGSDTFGDPIFQNGLQNQPSSRIISILGCFAQLCQLGAKCKNWTFKVNFLCQKSSESFSIFFSLKNTNLGAHFLLLTLFDNINFSTTLLLKLGQIFDEVAKLGKSTQERMANFVSPFEKWGCRRCRFRG